VDDAIADNIEQTMENFSSSALIDGLIGGSVILLVLIFSYMTSRDIDRRIGSLEWVISNFANSKDLSTEIRVYDKDEFGGIRTSLRSFIKVLNDTIVNAQNGARENQHVTTRMKEAFELIRNNIDSEATIISQSGEEAGSLKAALISWAVEVSPPVSMSTFFFPV